MTDLPVEENDKQTARADLQSYIIGFFIALILTLAAYFTATNHWFSGGATVGVLAWLAFVQLVVQLVFFLHFGRERKAHWNQAAFYFMLIILIIIVGGSLWIMGNLNYNMMMSPEQMNEYMLKESNKGF